MTVHKTSKDPQANPAVNPPKIYARARNSNSPFLFVAHLALGFYARKGKFWSIVERKMGNSTSGDESLRKLIRRELEGTDARRKRRCRKLLLATVRDPG